MRKREIRKLTLAKETLRNLEERRLQQVAGGTGESICICDTDLCVSGLWTNCIECNS